MILGQFEIDSAARTLHTHRDSYLLDQLTAVSVRRPLLPGGLALGIGLSGFGLRFEDLLYPTEINTLVGVGIGALVTGLMVGQLRLLSRDLHGSELSGAIWGSYGALNRVRRAIARAIHVDRANGGNPTHTTQSRSEKR